MSENTIQITDAQFEEEVLKSGTPVLVDFWAPWCGPCKMIAPVLEEVAGEFKEKLNVVKLNVDENQDTAPKFNVRGIPTLLIFKDGEVVGTKVGAVSKTQLVAFINDSI